MFSTASFGNNASLPCSAALEIASKSNQSENSAETIENDAVFDRLGAVFDRLGAVFDRKRR